MEIQSTVAFLVGSILTSIGIIVFAAAAVVVNNLFAKYWKPVKWSIYQHQDIHVVDREVIEDLKQSLDQQKEERKQNARR